MNANQYLTEALGEGPGFTPEESLAIEHLMGGYAREVMRIKALSGTSASVCSVSGDEIHEEFEKFKKRTPRTTMPYGGTVGFWNQFISRMDSIGFEIKRKQNENGDSCGN